MSVYALTRMKIEGIEYAVCFGLDDKRNLTSFHLSPLSQTVQINNIYIGRVDRIIPKINAAFVNISESESIYLPLAKASRPVYTSKGSKKAELTAGDQILVQISQEALKTKDAQGSCELSLQSNYFVLTVAKEGFYISHKIDGSARERIKSLLDWYENEYLKENPTAVSFGLVTRTIAASAEPEALKADLVSLTDRFKRLTETDIHKTLYSLLYREIPSFIGHLKSVSFHESDRIVTDDREIYRIIGENIPTYSDRLSLYDDNKVSLSVLYNLKGNIDSVLSKQIWLKSGGNIIIEQLETLTFIDVNSAKSSLTSGDAFSVNKEALREICRQLRLRNISGMILIDFINMNEEDTEEIGNLLKNELKEDSIPCKFHDFTALGLAEVTRKKTEKSVLQILGKRSNNRLTP